MAKKKVDSSVTKANLPAKARKPKPADTVYQFRITLRESHPAIWRRAAPLLPWILCVGELLAG
jgi:hypothetical protein